MFHLFSDVLIENGFENGLIKAAWKVSVFGVILVHIFRYSVQMRGNPEQKNSEYKHFLRSEEYICFYSYYKKGFVIGLVQPYL